MVDCLCQSSVFLFTLDCATSLLIKVCKPQLWKATGLGGCLPEGLEASSIPRTSHPPDGHKQTVILFTWGRVWGSPWGAQVHWDQLLPPPIRPPLPSPILSVSHSQNQLQNLFWMGESVWGYGWKTGYINPSRCFIPSCPSPPSPEARKAKGTVLELTLLLCLNISLFHPTGKLSGFAWQGPYNGHLKTLAEDGKLSPCVAPCACLLATIHSCFPWCLAQGWHEIANQIW